MLYFSLLLTLIFSVISALYSSKDEVVLLSSSNFDKKVLKSNAVWVVEFFAPWCGHCKALAPEYKKAASKSSGVVKFAAIDCDQELNKPLCGKYGIKGFPTIKLFPGDKTGSKKIPLDYNGERVADPLLKWAQARIPNIVLKLSSSSDLYEKNNDTSKVLLFTDKPKTPNVFKSLALDGKGKFLFLEASSKSEASKDFDIQTFPTLLVLTSSGQFIKYEGNMKYKDIKAFLKSFSKGASDSSESSPEEENQEKKNETPKRKFIEEVAELKYSEDFEENCAKKCVNVYSCLCFIAFLPPVESDYEESVEQHNNLIATLKTLNKKLFEDSMIPVINYMWLDGYKYSSIVQKFGASSDLPSGLILSPERNVYGPLLAGFDKDNLEKFIRETIYGKTRLYKFSFDFGLPQNPNSQCTADPSSNEGSCSAEKKRPSKSGKDEL